VGGEVRYYTLEDAARMMRLTPERVKEMLESGELEGFRTGHTGGWRIPIHHTGPSVPSPATLPPAPPPVDPSLEPSAKEPEDREDADANDPTALPSDVAETRELPGESGEPGPPVAELEEARQTAELPRGDDAASDHEATSVSGWVTTQQAARALGISARTVRWHIERGNIVAKPEGEGVERTWRVSVDSLHAFRDARQLPGQSPRDHRAEASVPEIAPAAPGSAIRELADRLVEEARRAEAAKVRLELAERAQSTLEAELAEERRRRQAAERAREEAQRERDELRRRLESTRHPEPPAELPKATPTREIAPQPAETPAQGFGTDAASGGPQRQAPSRWRRLWHLLHGG
jgi:Helix-turn-helix domain